MKILIFVSLFIGGFIQAQTNESLDSKNGFKEIKLGKSVLYYKTIKLNNSSYLYTGECCKVIYGVNINRIVLTTNSSKKINFILLEISFNDDRKYKFSYFEDKLSSSFGKRSEFNSEDDENGNPTGNFQSMWTGNKVSLVWSSIIQDKYEDGWKHTIGIVLNSTLDKQNDW